MGEAVVGKNIKHRRQQAVLTVRELAEKASITPTTLSSIETGKHSPRPATIRKIAAALGIQPTELVGS